MKHMLFFALALMCLAPCLRGQVVVSKGDLIEGTVLADGKTIPAHYKVWRTGVEHGHVCLGADVYGQPAIDTVTSGRVVIPDSIIGPDGKYYYVRYVARQAFAHCRRLTEVVFPKELNFIGDQAFLGCSSLTEITLPRSTKIIYPCAFRNCPRLRIVRLNRPVLGRVYNDIFDRHTIEHGTLFIPAGTSAVYADSHVWGMFAHRFEMLDETK